MLRRLATDSLAARRQTMTRVKGTGVGEKVKGRIWERKMRSRLDKRKKAMEGMGALVQEWKQVYSLFFMT